MPLTVTLNGQSRTFPNLAPQATLGELVQELGLKGDRVAIEHNGEISPRTSWNEVRLQENDRLEVVHFVGGGTA
jgi:sulfur carrier protein